MPLGIVWWDRAEGCWREYMEDASRSSIGEELGWLVVALGPRFHALVRSVQPPDRWIDVARARFTRAHAQRIAAERRVKGRIAYAQYECLR